MKIADKKIEFPIYNTAFLLGNTLDDKKIYVEIKNVRLTRHMFNKLLHYIIISHHEEGICNYVFFEYPPELSEFKPTMDLINKFEQEFE